jgi:hypothetical protein
MQGLNSTCCFKFTIHEKDFQVSTFPNGSKFELYKVISSDLRYIQSNYSGVDPTKLFFFANEEKKVW